MWVWVWVWVWVSVWVWVGWGGRGGSVKVAGRLIKWHISTGEFNAVQRCWFQTWILHLVSLLCTHSALAKQGIQSLFVPEGEEYRHENTEDGSACT